MMSPCDGRKEEQCARLYIRPFSLPLFYHRKTVNKKHQHPNPSFRLPAWSARGGEAHGIFSFPSFSYQKRGP